MRHHFRMIFGLLFPLLAFPAECLDARVDKTVGVVHAHRGMGHGPGENTVASLKKAFELGADVLELDLQVTKDSQLVLHHDGQVQEHCFRPAGDSLPTREIGELTLSQLRGFRCGKKDETGGEHGIATLAELFAALKGRGRFNIELKANAKKPPEAKSFARLVLAELRHAEALDRVIVQSFDLKYLAAVREEVSLDEKMKLQLSYLMGWGGWTSNWTKLARDNGLQLLSPSVQKLRFGKSTVESLHAAGVKVVPYSPDTEAEWEKYLELGVDGLITNRPKELIEWLKARPKYRCLTNAP